MKDEYQVKKKVPKSPSYRRFKPAGPSGSPFREVANSTVKVRTGSPISVRSVGDLCKPTYSSIRSKLTNLFIVCYREYEVASNEVARNPIDVSKCHIAETRR